MSDNIQAVKAFYEAVASGNIPGVIGALDAQCVWNEAENFIYADRNPCIGPQAILMGVFARFAGEWEGFSAIPESFTGDGDTVISQGRYKGKYKATGKTVNAPFAHAFTLRDGKIFQFQQYTDTAQFRNVTA